MLIMQPFSVLAQPVMRQHGGGRLRTRQISRQEPIAPSEADRISEESAGDGIPRAQTRTDAGRLGLLSLQTDVQLEVIDMAIKSPGRFLSRIISISPTNDRKEVCTPTRKEARRRIDVQQHR